MFICSSHKKFHTHHQPHGSTALCVPLFSFCRWRNHVPSNTDQNLTWLLHKHVIAFGILSCMAWWLQAELSSVVWHSVVCPNTSEEPMATTIRMYGSVRISQNIHTYLPDYSVSHSRRCSFNFHESFLILYRTVNALTWCKPECWLHQCSLRMNHRCPHDKNVGTWALDPLHFLF